MGAGIVTALRVEDCLSVAVYRFDWDIPREAIVMTDTDGNVWESSDTTHTAGMYAKKLAKTLWDGLQAAGALPVEKGQVTKQERASKPIPTQDAESGIREIDHTELRRVLVRRFNESELRDLCFDLDVEYDSLSGEGTSDKARELITYCEGREYIPELVRVGKQQRPDITWADVTK